MTVTQIVLMLVLILVILVGAYLLYRSFRSSTPQEPEHIDYDKNGIPIIPRHERNLIDDPDFDDTLAGETVITPNRSRLQAVIDEGSYDHDVNYADNNYLNQHAMEDAPAYNPADDMDGMDNFGDGSFGNNGSFDNDNIDSQIDSQVRYVDDERGYISQAYGDQVSPSSGYDDGNDWDQVVQSSHQASDTTANHANVAINAHTDSNTKESDLFSSLASATENIMPAVDIAEEPEFDDNSPVLDQHLLAEADQDQNSPLNHAEENINISLVPKNRFDTIDGATIRALVEQYGLKYGAMNMFHRYENKDGTGILWFSMMGVTVDGVAPFDLNTLMTTEYNGLVLFLSLPHPKAVQGFDSMMSVAGLIARQLDTQILDEENRPLTRDHKLYLRQLVQDYQ